jgi:hypothetical protein
LAGHIKQLSYGRGKDTRTVQQEIPTHIGQVTINDPVAENDIINIVSYLEDYLSVSLTSIPLNSRQTGKQSKLKFQG